MCNFSTLSAVITTINETDSLKKCVEILLNTCNISDLEEIFIVVCDRTTEECMKTVSALLDMKIGIPIKMYKQQKPGLGPALHESMQRVKGSHAVNIAADLDTDPGVVKDMIKVAKEHPNAVILASRWIKGGGFEGYGQVHKALNYLFNKMLQILFFTRIKDLTYGFRFAPVDKVLSVNWESKGLSIGMETNLRMLRLGYEFLEVPAVWRVRKQGESQNSLFTKLKYIIPVLKVRFASKASLLSDVAERSPIKID